MGNWKSGGCAPHETGKHKGLVLFIETPKCIYKSHLCAGMLVCCYSSKRAAVCDWRACWYDEHMFKQKCTQSASTAPTSTPWLGRGTLLMFARFVSSALVPWLIDDRTDVWDLKTAIRFCRTCVETCSLEPLTWALQHKPEFAAKPQWNGLHLILPVLSAQQNTNIILVARQKHNIICDSWDCILAPMKQNCILNMEACLCQWEVWIPAICIGWALWNPIIYGWMSKWTTFLVGEMIGTRLLGYHTSRFVRVRTTVCILKGSKTPNLWFPGWFLERQQ